MAAPFLPAIAGALTLAVLFTPMQRWFESKLRHPSLAALISILLIGIIVVVPAVLVGQTLVMQATKGAELIETKVATGEWRRSLQAQPRIAPIITTIEKQLDLPGTVKDLTTWLSLRRWIYLERFGVSGHWYMPYLLPAFLFPARRPGSSSVHPITVTPFKKQK